MSPTVVAVPAPMQVAQGLAPVVLVGSLLGGVDVSPPGYAVRVTWAPAAGATSAEVTSGQLTVAQATTTAAMGALAVSDAGDAVDVAIPGGKHVRSLALAGLKLAGGTELRSADDLRADADGGSLRLVVSTLVGGKWTPLCVVPGLGGHGVLPAQLTGASFTNGVLSLPDPAAPRLRLALARGDQPEELATRATELAGAQGTAAVPSAALQLIAPDGAAVWAFPGELPDTAQTVDLRTPVKLALDAALGAGGAPDVAFRLRGAAGMQAGATIAAIHGALVRTTPGTTTVELQGDPVALALGAPLAAEAPASAVADVAVRYAGVRLHDAVRDAVPVAAGDVGGPIVGEAPVVRALPAAALHEHPVAKAAPIGRAPEGCALSVELVDLTAGPPGTPLGPPGTIELPASGALSAPWVQLPPLPACDVPAGLSVRATAGRFLWAAGSDGAPLLRLAVTDPDPAGRPLRLGSATLLSVADAVTSLPARALPAAVLHGPAAPTLASDLFCSVDLADLTLRYAR